MELFGPAKGLIIVPVYHPPHSTLPKKKTEENYQTVRITNNLTVYLRHTIPIDTSKSSVQNSTDNSFVRQRILQTTQNISKPTNRHLKDYSVN